MPSPERWSRVEEIFDRAVALDESARAGYLDAACAGDADLRKEVDGLLASDSAATTRFLEEPAVLAVTIPAFGDDARLAEPSLVGLRLGAYRIDREIGRGGMGMVYRASRADGAFEQHVALKLIKNGLGSAELVARFRRERQILALVNHPNIARLIDGGTAPDGRPYFVMELVEGRPLMQYCSDVRASLHQRLTVFLEICAAVAHAHQNLVVHRDLKPANILVSDGGQAKLLDFGIGKLLHADVDDPAQTRLSAPALLTPEYASPEQVRGSAVTTATDVYALGLILFELLTGQKAQRVTGASLPEVDRAVCQTEPRRPSATELRGVPHTAATLRGDLDTIVLKALQKDPERRYGTVSELAADIRRFEAGEPVSARPDSVTYLATKFVRRNRTMVAVAAVATVAVTAGIAATAWQAGVARERAVAVRELSKAVRVQIDSAAVDVPGATKARLATIQQSIAALDGLANVSANDSALLQELAESYEAAATIQGNRNRSNLGDYEGAMRSYRKALELRERAQAVGPSPENVSWIAMISAEAARVYPNSDESRRLAESGVEKGDWLVRSFPPPRFRGVPISTNFTLGYVLLAQEKLDEAFAAFTRSRDASIELKRSKNNISVNERYLATILRMQGRFEAALERAESARALDEAYVVEKPGPRSTMDLTYDYAAMAWSLSALGRHDEARQFAEKTARMRRELATADTADQRATMGIVDSDELLGVVLGRAGERDASISALSRAVEGRKALVQAAPDSPQDAFEEARTLAEYAANFARFGMCAEAQAPAQRARDTFEAQHREVSLRLLGSSMDACHGR